ncbi:DNA-3-methyladenine glycosylase family protein [Candidatus Avelusimicrobium fimicolum]|uniref:DNA-3-methyladenine glycosylase family protein n=1 Tax=Candidatus Avelusimicrobium fimicolum TaxID=3416216 RepID=UPI003D0EB2FC
MIQVKNDLTDVTIKDDFDLNKIISSGQIFRAKKIHNYTYRFITKNKVLYISSKNKFLYKVNCDINTWKAVWVPYFSLETNYRHIRLDALGIHPFIDRAIDKGKGLRILRQDPWEMLITFIISQRKTIPAITSAVQQLSNAFGSPIKTPWEIIYTFPSPKQLQCVTAQTLQSFSLGYRARYVLDAIEQVLSGKLQLNKLSSMSDKQLLHSLLQIKGVGEKVANCVGLFSYGRVGMVPIDTWIKKAINEDCHGHDPFTLYKNMAGIIQQYVFYYQKHCKS